MSEEQKEIMKQEALDSLREALEARYPAGVVPRPEIGEATGGILHPATQANRDCRGDGIPERFKIGKTIYYQIPAVLKHVRRQMV